MMSLMSGFPQNIYHHPLHHHHPHQHGGMVFSSAAAAANDASSAAAAATYSAYYPAVGSTGAGESAATSPYYWPPTSLDSPPTQSSTSVVASYYDSNPSNPSNNPSHTGDILGPPIRGVKRRVTANRKERRRTLSINTAFSDLRECIPNVPSDTKLSKIKTLRLATSYIAYLMDILAKDDPNSIPEGGFKADVSKKMESRDERKKKEMANLLGPTTSICSGGETKKAKGRTGWPQHVWALELKQ